MTDTQRKRDPRYTRTIGEKPDLGRRYVENGKVKIEWYEGDKKRSRTIGDNSAQTRREADEELELLLGLSEAEREENEAGADAAEEVEEGADGAHDEINEEEWEEECVVVDLSGLFDELRDRADALMDVADEMAEAFERGLVRMLDLFRHSGEDEEDETDADDEESDVEDADVVEEIDDEEEAGEKD